MSPEELKALLSTPTALFVLMLVGSFASMLKQVSDAKKNESDVTLGSYLAHWPETITTIISNIFAFIGLLMVDQLNFASAVGIGYMANSGADLVRMGGRSAAVATKASAHWLITLLAAVVALCALGGCATSPTSVLQVACEQQEAYRVERCAKAIAETYEVYQRRGQELVSRPDTPQVLKDLVRKADARATPVVVELLRTTQSYLAIKVQIAAGTGTPEAMAAQEQALAKLVTDGLLSIDALIRAIAG